MTPTVSQRSTRGEHGLIASHVPVILLPALGPSGTLQLHLAKPNPQCDDLAAGAEVLVIFHGPHGYISPTWYATATSVPTWNYVAVHAYGTPRVLSDDDLRHHLDALVETYESGQPDGWNTDKLPGDTSASLRGAIIGFEVPIARLQGKWKLGQNRVAQDRMGAIDGLRSTGAPNDATLAEWMASTLKTA